MIDASFETQTVLDEQADPLLGSVIADRYRIEQMLGVGGMGTVYRAEHVRLRKPMAVKVLHRELTSNREVVARFEREAIAAARIDHPNVVTANDFGTLENGSFFLVLEYIDGQSLRDVLDKQVLEPVRELRIMRQMAEALSAAHDAHIVHRDLKPENVMLVELRGCRDIVKVLDFGIAKITSDDTRGAPQLTMLGSVFGTPEYMAPEQASGRAVDHRADLYALGIILFEMLSGRPPFVADDVIHVLGMHLRTPPPALPSGLPAGLNELVQELLAKDPAKRLQSAAELVTRIDRLLSQLDASSLPPGTNTRAEIASSPTILASEPSTVVATASPGGQPVSWRALAVQQVAFDKVRVPVWLLGAAAAGVVAGLGVLVVGLLIAVLVSAGSDTSSDSLPVPEAASVPSASGDPELDALAQAAAAADSQAIDKVEALVKSKPSALLYMALAKGKASQGKWAEALRAYEQALRLEPSRASDPQLIGHVREAAHRKDTAHAALTLASTLMGADGADLLYELWVGSKDASTKQLALGLFTGAQVQAKASPAVRIAFELRQAKTCTAIKTLLARAREHGDSRSLPVLEKLTVKRGCGVLGLGDCWGCMRGDSSLSEAIAAIRARASLR